MGENIPAWKQRDFLSIYSAARACLRQPADTQRPALATAAAVATHLLLESGAVSKRGGDPLQVFN